VSFRYRLLYRLGITPWERDEVPAKLREVAGEWERPGRALDLGCGTGRDAVHLAREGWTVTGVDGVPQALEEARQRGAAAGAEVDWIEGDVTRLGELGLRGGYDLVLDRGCFHGLSDADREACARGVNALAAPGASLVIFAFAPGFHGPAPRGISAAEIASRFGPDWELVSSERDAAAKLPPWMRNANPSWHRLKRES
jgi:SAM-dependent methyltransferase